MRLGVVSDTHNNHKSVETIIGLFNQENVDRVIHTGDITRANTLALFAKLECPLYGVFGNNDLGEKPALQEVIDRYKFQIVDPPLELYWAERRIIVVHDPLEFNGHLCDDYHLALHGHTHMQRIEYNRGQLTFNPGECAGHMEGLNAIGVVDLETLRPEILNF